MKTEPVSVSSSASEVPSGKNVLCVSIYDHLKKTKTPFLPDFQVFSYSLQAVMAPFLLFQLIASFSSTFANHAMTQIISVG